MSNDPLIGEGPAVPESVLQGLRAVHPKADCIWIPGPASRGLYYEVGIWYEPDQIRRRIAEVILERESKKPEKLQKAGKIRWAKYVQRGWRPTFGIQGRVPDARDVNEFADRDRRYRVQFEAELKQRERDAERLDAREEADKQFEDHIHQFANEEYASICKAKNSYGFDGYAKRFGTRWDKQEEPCHTSDPG